METRLPEKFLIRMKELLKQEYEPFLRSYHEQRFYGLRVNTLKTSVQEFLDLSDFELEPVPWTRDGFYYKPEQMPGKHPYYHAGLYYIQEPSAMAPGAIIDAKPGEKILDLCAAPGGKTIQMAAGLNGDGLIVANDINASRVKALVKNIELYGVRNSVVTNETPTHLADKFPNYFDKILIDAPCSGEGMMRKDPNAIKSWEKYDVQTCCTMQRDILKFADKMLKDGGVLCYSTCTFSPEENEENIEWFLENNPGYQLIDIEKSGGATSGRADWVGGRESLDKCIRFWPHMVRGEGHFIALMKKDGTLQSGTIKKSKNKVDSKAVEIWYDFARDVFNKIPEGIIQTYGNNLYIIPDELPDIRGLNVVRTGFKLGSIEKGRFEPSQALVMGLEIRDFKNIINFKSGSQEVVKYLKGETLLVQGQKGWTVVCVDGYPLGWGKQGDGILKNKYPKMWRNMS